MQAIRESISASLRTHSTLSGNSSEAISRKRTAATLFLEKELGKSEPTIIVKFNTMKTHLFAAACLVFATSTCLAVPATVIAPVDGLINIGATVVTGSWAFNQHGTGAHSSSGGIGKCDDTMAWDANLYLANNSNADLGKPVYAIADGYVDTSVTGWGGSSYNQVLIRHTDDNRNVYYSGYLHMTNIITRTGSPFVRAGTVIGNVGRTGPGITNDHLHFAVYDMVNGKLTSRNATIEPRITAPTGLGQYTGTGRVNFSWLGAAGANSRIQVSTGISGFTEANGWTSSPSASSTVPVNAATSAGSSSYTWISGSNGSYAAPQSGQTYYWSVRQNTAARGASVYSQPRSFIMPGLALPVISLSTSSILASASRNSNPTSSSFTIRNSGRGTLSYSISSNASWMRVSPSTGTSTGGTNYVTVNYSTSSYSPQTLYGTLSVSGGSAGTQTISVQVTIAGADDHGNYTWNASNLNRNSRLLASIEQAGDIDMFRITVTSAGNVTVFSTGTLDTTGTLLNANGNQLYYNDDYTDRNFYMRRYLVPGTYYLAVRGYGNSKGNYTVYYN
jgi:hypothetical protein